MFWARGVSSADFGQTAETGTGRFRAQLRDTAPQLCHSERGCAAGAHGNSLGMEMLRVVCSNFNTTVCTAAESLRLRTETTAFHWLIADPILLLLLLLFIFVFVFVGFLLVDLFGFFPPWLFPK